MTSGSFSTCRLIKCVFSVFSLIVSKKINYQKYTSNKINGCVFALKEGGAFPSNSVGAAPCPCVPGLDGPPDVFTRLHTFGSQCPTDATDSSGSFAVSQAVAWAPAQGCPPSAGWAGWGATRRALLPSPKAGRKPFSLSPGLSGTRGSSWLTGRRDGWVPGPKRLGTRLFGHCGWSFSLTHMRNHNCS